MTPRQPTTTALQKQLQEIVSRMDTMQSILNGYGGRIETLEALVKILNRWHEDTDFAKKILEDFQKDHPTEAADSKPVVGSYKWMLVTLLAIIMALIGAFIAHK